MLRILRPTNAYFYIMKSTRTETQAHVFLGNCDELWQLVYA